MSDYLFEIIKSTLSRLGKWILLGVVNSSYWILLFCCILALVLYIGGLKKAGKYVSVTFILYCFLQAIKGLLI